MNNEPVAWISVLALDHIGQKFTDVRISLTKTDVADIPLYTHPAKTDKAELDTRSYMLGYADGKEVKTLTDEEIDAISDAVSNLIDTYAGRREFARAILRKAQEK